jgi:hypothetical protein
MKLSMDKLFSVSDRRMSGWRTGEVISIMEMEVSFSLAQHPLVGQGLLIIEVSRSHSDTLHSVGFLWTSDQPDLEISDNTRQSQKADNHAPSAIPSCERPQTHALGRAVTEIGWKRKYSEENLSHWHLVHHSSHTDSLGNEPMSPR